MKITLEQLLSTVYLDEKLEVYDKDGIIIIDDDCINQRDLVDEFSNAEVINIKVKSSLKVMPDDESKTNAVFEGVLKITIDASKTKWGDDE